MVGAYWHGGRLELRIQFDAKNLSLITVYGLAFKFDAVADLKELQIRKSSVLLNDCIRIRFEF